MACISVRMALQMGMAAERHYFGGFAATGGAAFNPDDSEQDTDSGSGPDEMDLLALGLENVRGFTIAGGHQASFYGALTGCKCTRAAVPALRTRSPIW